MLFRSRGGGLQLLDRDGSWLPVETAPRNLIVDSGDMMARLTNGIIPATTHRVVTREPRFSSAYFHGPDLRAGLEPLDLGSRFVDAVASSPRHRDAGFMARREELLAGSSGTTGRSAGVFGEQLWNYYRRSYPDLVAHHHPGTS